ncbi:MAG: hypothetical protein DYG93_04200 [Leptolyngbya sp. PLA2]|nr:hypothetical protein [Leptolyngbya sp.]MCE7970853.1 hypothetical protein [Leptolyngbya sp. PL-A2]MCQ3940332.1 hypothetical protein [cyanobacterium CYA1]MCZ7633692.1 hypothetical protein [Phycisphaerales bacterium]MDL1904598.1 hypothetical protein [Synechococcales cyanobacterium CNB]GIK17872.1 MAG: hypothetical protein BroJett004_00360 [Planctomycetota bacterium]
MSTRGILLFVGVAASAAVVGAQPVVDGQRDALYGAPIWVQTNPTQFGDSGQSDPCDDEDVGWPDLVTTGVEMSIPLSALGNPAGAIRICAFVNGSGNDFVSNQILGGLLPGTSNPGEPRNVNLKNYGGTQHVEFTPAVVGAAPIIDGTLDGVYGAPVAVQTNRTGFGDANMGAYDYANGSELDALYAVVHDGRLYVMVTGNLESNFNKFTIFFDTIPGGQNKLRGDNPDIDFNGLNRMGDDGSGNGLEFDEGFEADYVILFGGGGEPYTIYPNYAEVMPGGIGRWLGAGSAVSDGVLFGGSNPDDIRVTINNSNVDGVFGSCPPPSGTEDHATGSELNAVYSYFDGPGNRLYLMITGNLENGSGSKDSNSGNKLNLFLDAAPGGQNRLRGDNVDISFGNLNRMGDEGFGNGLTFDAAFEPNYWMSIKINDNPPWQTMDCAVLRTNGPLKDFNGNNLDYGAWDNNPKSDRAPVPFDGPRVDVQDGFTPQLYTNYAPRTTQIDPFNPVPGLLLFYLDNSNVGGVTDTDTSDAPNVTAGFEIAIDLDELGWDGVSEIKLAGFIASPDSSYLSNQVIGGLPAGTGNLGAIADVRNIDFADYAGDQFVVVPTSKPCPADFNGDTIINSLDFIAFLNAYVAQDPRADFNGDTIINSLDFIAFLNAYVAGCS